MSPTNRTASALNVSVYRRHLLVVILTLDFILFLLIHAPVKSGEGHFALRGLLSSDHSKKGTSGDGFSA